MALVQVLISGLSLSGYYALLAIGFAMIFSVLRIFHIAYAVVFATAGYVFFFLYRSFQLNLFLSAIVAIGAAAIVGLAIDKGLYQPILKRGGGLFSVFIASLGLTLLFEAVVTLPTHGVISIAHVGKLSLIALGPLTFRVLDVEAVVLVAVAYSLVFYWVMYTRTGLEIRALTDNAGLANVVGVNVSRTRNSVFLVASGLAGLSGVFTTYNSGLVPSSGLNLMFIIMAAVIFGGTRNILMGSLGGSLVMGLVTALTGFFFPTWVTVSVFLVLILVLIVRPSGLLA